MYKQIKIKKECPNVSVTDKSDLKIRSQWFKSDLQLN